jgi:hypothetical protein
MLLQLALFVALNGYRYGGTFIGAVICSDGIVMASDSRITFVDRSGRAFGYVDGFPKIYVDRDAAVAVTGLTSVEDELFSSFVNRNHFLLERPANEILFGFGLWLPFTNSNNVGMISAGFVEGKPMLCSKAPIGPQSCSNSGFISNKNSLPLRDRLTRLGHPPTTAEAADALKVAIDEYSRTDQTVGGAITILKLTNEERPEWLANPSLSNNLTQICDLVREHRAGHRRISPLGTPEELDQQLKAACPK